MLYEVITPQNGIVELGTDSLITYTPNSYFKGQDQFIYGICNFRNECDEATVLVMVTEEPLFIPNAFSPNGDGYNDYFEIKQLVDFPNAHLKVFNRWGNLVYEMKQYGNSPGGNGFWDGKVNRGLGTANGDVPTGTRNNFV